MILCLMDLMFLWNTVFREFQIQKLLKRSHRRTNAFHLMSVWDECSIFWPTTAPCSFWLSSLTRIVRYMVCSLLTLLLCVKHTELWSVSMVTAVLNTTNTTLMLRVIPVVGNLVNGGCITILPSLPEPRDLCQWLGEYWCQRKAQKLNSILIW